MNLLDKYRIFIISDKEVFFSLGIIRELSYNSLINMIKRYHNNLFLPSLTNFNVNVANRIVDIIFDTIMVISDLGK